MPIFGAAPRRRFPERRDVKRFPTGDGRIRTLDTHGRGGYQIFDRSGWPSHAAFGFRSSQHHRFMLKAMLENVMTPSALAMPIVLTNRSM